MAPLPLRQSPHQLLLLGAGELGGWPAEAGTHPARNTVQLARLTLVKHVNASPLGQHPNHALYEGRGQHLSSGVEGAHQEVLVRVTRLFTGLLVSMDKAQGAGGSMQGAAVSAEHASTFYTGLLNTRHCVCLLVLVKTQPLLRE